MVTKALRLLLGANTPFLSFLLANTDSTVGYTLLQTHCGLRRAVVTEVAVDVVVAVDHAIVSHTPLTSPQLWAGETKITFGVL